MVGLARKAEALWTGQHQAGRRALHRSSIEFHTIHIEIAVC